MFSLPQRPGSDLRLYVLEYASEEVAFIPNTRIRTAIEGLDDFRDARLPIGLDSHVIPLPYTLDGNASGDVFIFNDDAANQVDNFVCRLAGFYGRRDGAVPEPGAAMFDERSLPFTIQGSATLASGATETLFSFRAPQVKQRIRIYAFIATPPFLAGQFDFHFFGPNIDTGILPICENQFGIRNNHWFHPVIWILDPGGQYTFEAISRAAVSQSISASIVGWSYDV